ncbi:copper amine oxidase [Paenibacillus oenotherae]|uniref:Copper amine oxidase n=1 Tax=Paenibacillus oenotherae TaxID=1435645 RepID=A0ABS7D6A5_9BACL|nr:copper amine oxidase [Paenibacillus oenotherae]
MIASITAALTLPASAEERSSNISSFQYASLIKTDGTYWQWGGNQSVPTQVHGLADVKQSFTGQLIMKQDHTVWYWERSSLAAAAQLHPIAELRDLADVYLDGSHLWALNAQGQVFTAPTPESQSDAPEFTLLAGIDNVASMDFYYESYPREGFQRQLFLKKDGTVWKDNRSTQSYEPVASLNDIVAIDYNLALSKDGTVWSWPVEFTASGSADQLAAAKVKGLTGIQSIKSSRRANLAIDQQARLWFWGDTITGSSDGTVFHNQADPLRIASISNVTDALVVERSILVLTREGKVFETSIDLERMSPLAEFTLIAADVSEIKSGGRHLIMRKNDGTLWGWGVNKNGELGYGDYEFMHNTQVPMQRPLSIQLNDEAVVLTNGVITRSAQTFIPLRSVFEKLGASIAWDEKNKVATISRSMPGTPLAITINFKSAGVSMNNKPVQLQNEPFTVNGTAYLPLRFISEALGASVDWVPEEDLIRIAMQ